MKLIVVIVLPIQELIRFQTFTLFNCEKCYLKKEYEH